MHTHSVLIKALPSLPAFLLVQHHTTLLGAFDQHASEQRDQ